jgi:hypothetical protein
MNHNLKQSKLLWATLIFTGLLGACGGEGGPDGTNVSGLAADGNIERAEASALVSQRTEAGEPADVSGVTLRKSETEEPFDI